MQLDALTALEVAEALAAVVEAVEGREHLSSWELPLRPQSVSGVSTPRANVPGRMQCVMGVRGECQCSYVMVMVPVVAGVEKRRSPGRLQPQLACEGSVLKECVVVFAC